MPEIQDKTIDDQLFAQESADTANVNVDTQDVKEVSSNLSKLGKYIKSKIMRLLGMAENEAQLMDRKMPRDFNMKNLTLTGDGDKDTNVYRFNDEYIVKESLPDEDEGISTSQGLLQRTLQRNGVGKFFLGLFTEGKVLNGEEIRELQDSLTDRMKLLNKKAKKLKLQLGESLLDSHYLIRKNKGLPTLFTIQQSLPEKAILMSQTASIKTHDEKAVNTSFESFVKEVSSKVGKSLRIKKRDVAYDPTKNTFYIYNMEALL